MHPETPRPGTAHPRTAETQELRAEFTTEPFEGEGAPPAHAANALECLRAAGLEPEFGPLGTAVRGDRATVLPALADVLNIVLSSGADRITLQVTAEDQDDVDQTNRAHQDGEDDGA